MTSCLDRTFWLFSFFFFSILLSGVLFGNSVFYQLMHSTVGDSLRKRLYIYRLSKSGHKVLLFAMFFCIIGESKDASPSPLQCTRLDLFIN